jgi:hypothetical protein
MRIGPIAIATTDGSTADAAAKSLKATVTMMLADAIAAAKRLASKRWASKRWASKRWAWRSGKRALANLLEECARRPS